MAQRRAAVSGQLAQQRREELQLLIDGVPSTLELGEQALQHGHQALGLRRAGRRLRVGQLVAPHGR